MQTHPLVEPILSYCFRNLLHLPNTCSNSKLLHLIRVFLFHLQTCSYLSVPQRHNYHFPSYFINSKAILYLLLDEERLLGSLGLFILFSSPAAKSSASSVIIH